MAWYNESWTKRVKVTIDHTKVGATLSDFPVYIDLSELPADFHTNCNQTDARDIRVTTSDEVTEVPREVVFYDSATDTGELHFKAPSLSSSVDTDFYIYYGNASASDYATNATYGAENVWTNYKLVYHGSSTSDSSSNGNDLSSQTVGYSTTSTVNLSSSDKVTISYWADDVTSTGTQIIYEMSTNYNSQTDSFVSYIDSGNIDVSIRGNVGYNLRRSSINTTSKYYQTDVLDTSADGAGEITTYEDASVKTTTLTHSSNNTNNFGNKTMYFGGRGGSAFGFSGSMEDIRVYEGARSSDWIGAEYNNQSAPDTFATIGTAESVPVAEDWYNASWDYRVKITVQASQVDSTLSDFPVYVDLSGLPAGFHTNVNQTDGRDIRVTKRDGTTELPREVVFYDSATDTGELHFKADSLSSSANTEFYIYYGNASATEPASNATYGSENVWTVYSGIWHMGDASTTTITDSTSGGYTGTKLSAGNPSEATGKLGKAQSFSADRINMGDVIDIGTNDVSMSQWIKLTDISAAVHSMSKAKADGTQYRYSMRFSAGGTAGFFLAGASGSIIYESTTVVDDDTWHLITVVLDRSGSGTVYVDGTSIGSQSISTYNGQDFQSVCNFWLGAYPSSDNTSIYSSYPGLIDESRITLTALSADWIGAEYVNQATPTTFYGVGTQEEPSASGTNADSERGLYLGGKTSSGSERLLHVSGSQILSTDYFNVEFGSASTNADSERGLYIEGKDTSVSERALSVTGCLSNSSERTLYVTGCLSDNSERSLYLTDSDSGSSERSLYLGVVNTGSSTRNLYVPVDGGNYSDRFMYLSGKDTSSSERGLYVTGGYGDSSERSLYLEVVSTSSSERALYVGVVDIDFSERSLYLIGSIDDSGERNLYLEGFINENSERSLYLTGSLPGDSERNLYLGVVNTGSSERGIYLGVVNEGTSERNLYITGGLDDDSERLLYLSGKDTSSSDRNLYLTGSTTDSSERSLYLEVVSTGDSQRGLYITGCLSDNSERTLYLSVNQASSSERGMWLHGGMVGDAEVYFWDGMSWVEITALTVYT